MVVSIKIIFCIIILLFSINCNAASSNQIIRDAEIEFFLQKLINKIVINSDQKNKKLYPRLVLNDNYNAFVTGTDKVYVTSGLIKQAISIDEILGVLAHEIGHLLLNHHNSRMIDKKKASSYSKLSAGVAIALTLAGKLNEKTATGLFVGGQDLAIKSYLQFSRIQETQADNFALKLMKKSKISSLGIEQLHNRLSEEEYLNRDLQSEYYRSHPFFISRLDQIKRFKSNSPEEYKVTEHIFIHNQKITLEYINNKISSYNKDPFDIIKKNTSENNLLPLYSSTVAYLKVGKHNLAINNISLLLLKYEDYPFFYELAGDIYYNKGDFNLAILNYKIANEMLKEKSGSSLDLIKLSLAKSHLKTNEVKNIKYAIFLLEDLIQVNPKEKYVWRLLAQGYGKINKKGVSYIALAEEAMIKNNFIKAKKYVELGFKDDLLLIAYRLRGNDILNRISNKKK